MFEFKKKIETISLFLIFAYQVENNNNADILSNSSVNNDNKQGQHSTIRCSPILNSYHSKIAFTFQPIRQYLPNVNANPYHSSTHSTEQQQQQQQQQQYSPFLTISPNEGLSLHYDCQRRRSLLDDPTTMKRTIQSSSKQIPVVMITDTSSSNTNIVELETYEDRHRLLDDIEKRLSRELRASYRPRHST